MDNFWIIPIICFVIAGIFVGINIEYKINTVLPNAAIELVELENMNCKEIKQRNNLGNYWIPDNGKFAREKVSNCIQAENELKKAETERLNKLLADPNSFYSLTKQREKLMKEYVNLQTLFENSTKQTSNMAQQLADLENNITVTNNKLNNFYSKDLSKND